MKLWSKDNTDTSKSVEKFTVGKDREFDLLLAPFDILGSIAHAKMLASVGLLSQAESVAINEELRNIYKLTHDSRFTIDENVEDIHSQIELLLTQKLGDVGKKIHSARSRNDQVLVDVKLFLRNEIEELVNAVQPFFQLLLQQSEKYKQHLFPGYTHLQLAMPSSFGLWFGAYAESLVDDMITLQAAFQVVNKNPLGSAAGYGSSFPINRTMTTELLGFADLNYNVVYAQMGRGKAERITAMALANLADTLARMSMDACLYLNQNFDFISFPPGLTTGSSIMPHKKNPDVFELIRSHSNRIKALPNEIMLMTTNLPSGYHRDLQFSKEPLLRAFSHGLDALSLVPDLLSRLQWRPQAMRAAIDPGMYATDAALELARDGVPFREAYRRAAEQPLPRAGADPDASLRARLDAGYGNLEPLRRRLEES